MPRAYCPIDHNGESARVVLAENEVVHDIALGCIRLGDGKTIGGLLYERRPFGPAARHCQSSPFGQCQADTSMESGPNNCFYCERPMQ